jgi:hypothetical protein
MEMKPDISDIVVYGFGGGEPGSPWTELTIKGDGTLEYFFSSGRDRMRREIKLSSEDTQKLFQALVDDGLFQLRSEKTQGADIPSITIKAHIGGRNHNARIDITSKRSEQWQRIIGRFQRLLKTVLPD